MQNINGFPSNKHNSHKKRGINEIMGKQDIALFLETGINDNAVLQTCNDNIEIDRENKMSKVEK